MILTNQSILKLDDEIVFDINKSLYIEEIVDLNWIKTPFLKVDNDIFSLDKDEDVYILNISDINKYNHPITTVKNHNELYQSYYSNIKDIESNSPIYSKDIHKIISIIYTDVRIYLDLFKLYSNIGDKNISSFLLKKIKELISENITIVSNNSIHGPGTKHKSRSGLLKTNTNSIEWRKDKISKLDSKITLELKKLKCRLVELPKKHNKEDLLNFLTIVNKSLKMLNLKHHNFELRFKKLGLYKKEGMFIKKHNILIVDPRKTNAFYHELGHFIYENGLSFSLNGKRVYKSNFESISKKENIDNLMQSKLEDYDIKSEKFAYWFENNFQVK